jgi:hypothetical protein
MKIMSLTARYLHIFENNLEKRSPKVLPGYFYFQVQEGSSYGRFACINPAISAKVQRS